jgi:hypothetical protein
MLAVAQMPGHKRPDVTAEHYVQAAKKAAGRTKEALEQALFGTWCPGRWCQNGVKNPKCARWPLWPPGAFWRLYAEKCRRTQRDSNPRHLVPKNNVAMPASVFRCRHVSSIPSLCAKNASASSVWRGPGHSCLAQ